MRLSRGGLLLAAAIAAVFIAAASNVPESVKHSDYRKRAREAFVRWTEDNGGRRAYGVAVPEVHSKSVTVCAPHFPNPERRHGADYRIYLEVEARADGPARVLRAVRGPLEVKPTATGPKCGAVPQG